MRTAKNKNEKGYTLLEYCAGAAVVVSVLYTALNGMGTKVAGFMDNIGGWASKQAAKIETK